MALKMKQTPHCMGEYLYHSCRPPPPGHPSDSSLGSPPQVDFWGIRGAAPSPASRRRDKRGTRNLGDTKRRRHESETNRTSYTNEANPFTRRQVGGFVSFVSVSFHNLDTLLSSHHQQQFVRPRRGEAKPCVLVKRVVPPVAELPNRD